MLLVLELDVADLAATRFAISPLSETTRAMSLLANPGPPAVNRPWVRWARAELPLRLRCFENWLTERIRGQSGTPAFLTEVGAVTYLQRPQTVLNIRQLFELLDGVRDLKSALDTPINSQKFVTVLELVGVVPS